MLGVDHQGHQRGRPKWVSRMGGDGVREERCSLCRVCRLFVCMSWEVGDVMQECSRWESLSNPRNDGHLHPGAAVYVVTEAQTLGVLWSGKSPIDQIRCGLGDMERSEWFQGCSDLHGPRARKPVPPLDLTGSGRSESGNFHLHHR